MRVVVGRNIRALAREKDLTLERLADFADVGKSSLFAVLRGKQSPTTDWLARVAAALDVEPNQLLVPTPRRVKIAAEKKKRS